MRSYFDGRKREIGIVILVIACVVMAECARSISTANVIFFFASRGNARSQDPVPKVHKQFLPDVVFQKIWKQTNYTKEVLQLPVVLISVNGSIVIVTNSETSWLDWESRWEFADGTSSKSFEVDSAFGEGLNWHLRCCGFRYGIDEGENTVATIPYWSIGIPLTLISAWCLLSKPRTKPAAKPEPSDA
jgi:hypothetical protein